MEVVASDTSDFRAQTSALIELIDHGCAVTPIGTAVHIGAGVYLTAAHVVLSASLHVFALGRCHPLECRCRPRNRHRFRIEEFPELIIETIRLGKVLVSHDDEELTVSDAVRHLTAADISDDDFFFGTFM